MQTLILSLFCILIILPLSASAAPLNAGFVQGLWYADKEIFADTPTRIYVAFRNHTPDDLTGTVHFTVDSVRVGSSEVRALSGRVVEAWVDWTPTSGEHTIAATVENVALHKIGGETVPAEIASLTAEDTRTVDRDTDKDGIGNASDTDDDNDGISDDEERKNNTDPLVANVKQESEEEESPQLATVQAASDVQGFEQYLGEGTVSNLLGGITEEITEAKQSIDAYRTERKREMQDDLIPSEHTSGNATITRSAIDTEPKSLWEALLYGGKALIAHIWTFVLWLISNILAHPVLVQLLILIGILYGLFSFTRRFARRPSI
jgi:hypothetical protein